MREMKDSGVEWIGEIPAEWSVSRIKLHYEICLGKMLQPMSKGPLDTLEPYMCSANIAWLGVNLSKVKQMWFSPAEKKRYRLTNGDLLVAEGGDVAVSCIWKDELAECYVQNAVHRVRQRLISDNRFAYYWLFYAKNHGIIDLICNKATLAHFTKEKFGEILICIMSLQEQQAIADFLDAKCAEIDALSRDIQAQIDTLEQYKRSVIFEAVTKGLNPNMPMKDSGIKWVGKVPANWTVSPIRANIVEVSEKNIFGQVKQALKFTYGKIVPKTNFDADEDNYVASTILNYTIVKPGTIVLNGLNLNFDFITQRVGLVHETGVITSAYLTFRPIDCKKLSSEFIEYLLKSYDFCKAFHNMGGGVRKILNFSELKKVYIVYPSYTEQCKIVNYLDAKCAEIDQTIAQKQEQLDTLADYKKSLIYEYVTGKKEVPGS